MPFRLLADLTIVLHLVFVLFVVLGALLVLRRPWVVWLHVPAAAWGAWVEFAGWLCPLTPLENWLRTRAGDAAYETGFVEHYLGPVLYPEELSRELQYTLGALVLLINAAGYTLVLHRRSHA